MASSPAERRFQVDPGALGPESALEEARVGAQSRLQPERQPVPAALRGEMGQDRVRPFVLRQGWVEYLEVTQLAEQVPTGRGEPDLGAAVQVRGAGAFEADPEVLEIVVVADIGRRDQQPGARREESDVANRGEAAGVAGLLVVGQILDVDLSPALPGEVAEFRVDAEAPGRHVPTGDRRIVIRRDVPVPGQRDLRSGLAAAAYGRKQQAGLALVPDREGDPRRVEDRHAEEVQPDVATGADARLLVQPDLARPQPPVLVPARAGRVAHAAEHDLGLIAQAHRFGSTAHGAVQKLELRALECAAALAVERAALATHVQHRIEVLDVAPQRGTAVLGTDLGLVRREQALSDANSNVAAQLRVPAAIELAGVAGDLDPLVVRIRLQQFRDPWINSDLGAAARVSARRRQRDEQAGQQRGQRQSCFGDGSGRRRPH